jgi:hypothetical protein
MHKLLVAFFLLVSICNAQEKTKLNSLKINGLSFVASKNNVTETTIQPVLNVNANWVTLMPFGFMESTTATNVHFNNLHQWWGETSGGIKEASVVFKKAGVKTMLKPQIWVKKGAYVGYIKMNSEEKWLQFEKSYEAFILHYAQIAETEKFPLFCVGTELDSFVKNRPEYWKKLISKIKQKYHGKLTYAANWNCYQVPTFWKELHYIGVDAYFPLSESKTPQVSELNEAWKETKLALGNFSKKNKKPILLTEFGYRSVDYSANKPWDSNSNGAFNIEAQQNSLQSLFQTFWNEPWFAGGFLWKWFDNYSTAGGENHTGFTVQNKETESLIKYQYGK